MIGQNDYVLSLPAINGHVASRHCAKHFPPANDRYIVNVYTSPKITPNATYDPYSITFASADMEGSGLPRYIAHKSKRSILLNSQMYAKQARSSAFNMNNVYPYNYARSNVQEDQVALRAWHNDTLVFQHVPSVNAGGKVGFAAGAAAGTIFYGWKDGFTPIYNPEETLVDYSTDSAIYSSTRITPGDITKLEAYISAWDDPASAYASGIEVEVEIRSWNTITDSSGFLWNVEWPYGTIHRTDWNHVVNKPLYGLESLTNVYQWKMRDGWTYDEPVEIYDRGTFAVTDSSQLPKYDGGLVLNAENLPFGGAFLGSDNSVVQCVGVRTDVSTETFGYKCYGYLDLIGKTITITDPEPNWSSFNYRRVSFDVPGVQSKGLVLKYLGKADRTTHLETIAGNNLTDGVTGWVTLFDRG